MSYPAYPEVKPSGVEWLGDVPQDWQVTRLKYVTAVAMGQSPPSDQYNLSGEGLPFLQGNAEFTELSPIPKHHCIKAAKVSKVGDVLLSVRAPVGAMNVADQVYGIGRGLCAITPMAATDSRFLWHMLSHVRKELVSLSTGSTFDAVSVEEVRNTSLFLPPLPEQQQIAAFLDRKTAQLDAVLAQKERQLGLLAEKRQALISQAVTQGLTPISTIRENEALAKYREDWMVLPLKRWVKIKITDGPHETPAFVDDGVLFVSAEAVQNSRINFDGARGFITEEVHAKYSQKCRPVRGDILLCKSGATTGKSAMVDVDIEFSIWSPLALIRADDTRLDTRFLFYAFQTPYLQDQIALFANTNTQPNIGMNVIETLLVTAPLLDEQRIIVAYLDYETAQMDRIAQAVRAQIEKVREYRQALISAAVTGKIDVRGEKKAGISAYQD